MAEMSLVVKQAALEQMASAMTSAHEQIVSQVSSLTDGVNGQIQGWSAGTESRAAEMAYQRRLTEGVHRLTEALDKVRAKLDEVAKDAHETEVENVAIVD